MLCIFFPLSLTYTSVFPGRLTAEDGMYALLDADLLVFETGGGFGSGWLTELPGNVACCGCDCACCGCSLPCVVSAAAGGASG